MHRVKPTRLPTRFAKIGLAHTIAHTENDGF
jgi:hypothetical protein